jgi:hypothetical protein
LFYCKIIIVDIDIGLKLLIMCCSVVFAIVANVSAQSTSEFASGEAQRVYDLLNGLGCIGNENCTWLKDFTSTTACNYKPDYLKCNGAGLLSHLYVDVLVWFTVYNCGVGGNCSGLGNQSLTGTFASNLNTFSALTYLYVRFWGLQIWTQSRCHNNSYFFGNSIHSTLPELPAKLKYLYELFALLCRPFDVPEMCRHVSDNRLEGQLPPMPASLTYL